jgi:hypothetical protein
MRTYAYATVVILLGLTTGCKIGLPSQPASNGEPPFGATAYEQNLDAMLASQGTDQVEVLVRLVVPEKASELHDLLAADGSPDIVSLNAMGATDSATMTTGTIMFTGEMSNDALNTTISSYAASRVGGELRRQLEQAALAGNAFSVNQFSGVGKADEIRAWWHANSTQIKAVISTPSL